MAFASHIGSCRSGSLASTGLLTAEKIGKLMARNCGKHGRRFNPGADPIAGYVGLVTGFADHNSDSSDRVRG